MKSGGFARALEGLGMECREFGESVKKDIGERPVAWIWQETWWRRMR